MLSRFAFGTLLTFTALSYAQAPHAGKVAGHQPQSTSVTTVQAPERGTQDSPLIVEKSSKEQERDTSQWESDSRENAVGKKRDFLITCATLFVGFLQLVVLAGQILIYRRQTGIMESSLGEARRSADAARDSANEARDTARLTQCADVLIEFIELENAQPAFSAQSRMTMVFKNFGPTRANNVQFNFVLSIGTSGDVPTSLDPIVLGADATAPLIFKTLKELGLVPNIPDIEGGKMAFGFKGTISYEDVFGKRHKVNCVGDYNRFTRSFNAKQTPVTESLP